MKYSVSIQRVSCAFLFGFFFLIAGLKNTFAQLRQSADIPVFQNNKQLQLPWAGGMTAPQFSQFDLNNDGKPELVYFDRASESLTVATMQNVNNSTTFVQNLILQQTFPKDLHDWVLLRDFDCDGDADIFSAGFGSIRVHENTGSASFPEFTLLHEDLFTTIEYKTSTETTPVYCASTDVPAIDDIDGDGDLDILSFAVGGGYIEQHKNLSIENNGTCGLDMNLKNFCWGYVKEGLSDNQFALGESCDFNLKNPEKSGGAHAGSSILMLDIDANGRKDILVGDISFQNLVAVQMQPSTLGGDSGFAIISDFPSAFPVAISTFPNAFSVDINLDGQQDLLVAPGNKNGVHNYASVWAYTNSSQNEKPNFSFAQTDFLQNEMIELGEASYPTLFDINKDGLLDLFISSKGYSDGGAEFTTQIACYKNTGSRNNPIFSLVDKNWGNINALGVGFAHAISLHDIDGITYMAFGDQQGYLHWTQVDEQGNLSNTQLYLQSVSNTEIDAGQFSKPLLKDIDNDGLLDLLCGSRNGHISLFKNTTSNASPKFEIASSNFGNLYSAQSLNEFSALALFGDTLFVGNEKGKINAFLVNFSNSTLSDIAHEIEQFQFSIRAYPAIGKLTQDNNIDFVIGNKAGGVVLFTSEQVSSVNNPKGVADFSIYPNPSNGRFHIRGNQTIEAITIFDITGKFVSHQVIENANAEVQINLQPGIYLVRLEGNNFSHTQRIVVQ